jgi:dipeptidyl aminopeptidase/acylaminoacyl peptidase
MARLLRTLARDLCVAGVLVLQAAPAAAAARSPGPTMVAPPMLPAVSAPNRTAPPRATAPVSPPGAEIPLEAFAAGPQMSEPRISPDGSQLVYLATLAGRATVAVRNLRTGEVRAVLAGTEGDFAVSRCGFKAGDRLLCRLEGVMHGESGRPFPASRLVALDPDGGHVRLLFRNALFSPLAVSSAQFQDRIVHWLPDDPRHVLVELNEAGSIFPAVYRVDVYRGDLQLAVAAHPPVMDWTADRDGVVRFGYGFRDDTGVYIARSGPDAPWTTLEQFKRFDRARFDPLAFGPEPDELYVFAPYQGRTAVWQLDIAHGRDLKLVFSRPDVDVGGLLEWPTDRHVVGFVYETDKPHTEFVDAAAAAVDRQLEQALPGTFHVVVDATRDGSKLVTVAYSDLLPARYDLLDVASGALTPLGRVSGTLTEEQLAPMQPVVVPGEGGIRIPGYLTLPRKAPAGRPLPAVVLPHGGPYARDHWGYDPLVQMIASRGYAVLQLNFRGSTGYGEQWRNAGHQAWGTIMHADITAGARWLIAQGIADPARLCIVGWSYGGYAALIGVEKEPQLYRCAVSIAGVSDLTQMAQDDQRFYGGRESAGDSMGTDPAELRAESPLEHADRIRVPVLLIHGEDDYTVLVGQSKAMAAALERQGVRHRLVLIRHGDHSLLRPEMRLTLYREVSAFLDANLAPRTPPGAAYRPGQRRSSHAISEMTALSSSMVVSGK